MPLFKINGIKWQVFLWQGVIMRTFSAILLLTLCADLSAAGLCEQLRTKYSQIGRCVEDPTIPICARSRDDVDRVCRDELGENAPPNLNPPRQPQVQDGEAKAAVGGGSYAGPFAGDLEQIPKDAAGSPCVVVVSNKVDSANGCSGPVTVYRTEFQNKCSMPLAITVQQNAGKNENYHIQSNAKYKIFCTDGHAENPDCAGGYKSYSVKMEVAGG